MVIARYQVYDTQLRQSAKKIKATRSLSSFFSQSKTVVSILRNR